MDRPRDEIEFERNMHEMKFAPEIHEVNTRGSKKPIVSKGKNKARMQRLEQRLDYLNADQYETLVDMEGNGVDEDDPIVGNLQI